MDNLISWLKSVSASEQDNVWTTTCINRNCSDQEKNQSKPNGSKKLYFYKDSNRFYCFRCGLNGSWASFLTDYLNQSPVESDVNAFTYQPVFYRDMKWVKECNAHLLEHRQGRNIGLHYLINERGLALQTVKDALLGYDPTSGCITIPNVYQDRLYSIKGRVVRPQEGQPRYVYLKGKPIHPYGASSTIGTNHVVLVEGEFDQLAAKELISNVNVEATGGCQVFKPQWMKRFYGFDKIYLRYDLDAEDKVLELAEKLGPHKCAIVQLPGDIKDINDLLLRYKRDEATKIWKNCLKTARPLGKPLIAYTRDFVKESVRLFKDETTAGVSTGHPALDEVSGGIVPGSVYLLCGPQKKGKTQLATDILVNIAMTGKKIMMGSFEMKIDREMIPRILSKLLGRNFDLEKKEAIKDKNEAQLKTLGELYEFEANRLAAWDGIIWINRHDKIRYREIEDAVREGYREGARFLLLDHMQFICDFGKDEVFKATAKTSRIIKRLTNDYPELAIIMISQISGYLPHGDSKFKTDTRREMGGSSGSYDANQVWWLGGPYCEEDCLIVKDARDSSVKAGGVVRIQFDQRTMSYTIV